MRAMLRSTFRTAMLATGLAGISAPALACNSETYVGTICTYAFSWCPRNYIPADGRLLSVQQNQALFSLLGFTFGGDNSSTFGVPDLRGRVAVGSGTGAGLLPVGYGQKLGQQSLVLTPAQTPLLPHTHAATFAGTGGGSTTVNVPASTGGAGVSVNTTAVNSGSASVPVVSSGMTVYPANAGVFSAGNNTLKGLYTATAPATGTAATMPVTGNAAFSFTAPTGITGGTVSIAQAGAAATAPVSTQPPSLGMTVCIAAQGLYPDRP
ncbi:tail fiber protein [Methylobacterium sp. EM32]|uniref:phage tail protein n=1 Tax=Methylobacterium sp. EM32 TaxID=3163481 RepID=UPI0033AB95EF